MIYVVYLSTLIPHIKVRDNYPLSPTIIFSFPTAMQVKVDLSGEYFIFIDEMYLGGRGLYWQAGLNGNYFVTSITFNYVMSITLLIDGRPVVNYIEYLH